MSLGKFNIGPFFLSTIAFVATTCSAFPNSAQGQDTLDLDVTFIGDREMLLKDAHKLLAWPEAADLGTVKPTFTYSLLPKRLNVVPSFNPVAPMRLKIDAPLPRLYAGYLRAGYGTFNAPEIDMSYTDLRSRDGTWGIRANHRSSNSGWVNWEGGEGPATPEDFSVSQAEVWGTKLTDKTSWTGTANFRRDAISFYGQPFGLDSLPDLFDGKRLVNRMGASLNTNRFKADSTDWRHDVDVSYQRLSATAGTTVDHIKIAGAVGTFRDENRVFIDLGADINSQKTRESPTYKQATLTVRPQIETERGPLKVRVGAGLWIDARAEVPFRIMPLASAEVRLLRDLFIPYVEIGGGITQNHLDAALTENPFIELTQNWNSTIERFSAEGGLRGSITSAFSYRAFADFSHEENHMYLANDTTSSGRQFTAVYDTLSTTRFGGEALLSLGESFDLHAGLALATYSTKSQAEAWNLPNVHWSLRLDYHWDKFLFGLTTTAQSARNGLSFAPIEGGTTVNDSDPTAGYIVALPAFVDIGLEVEYRYNTRISAWFALRNLANQRYALWANYPTQPFRASFGASYAF